MWNFRPLLEENGGTLLVQALVFFAVAWNWPIRPRLGASLGSAGQHLQPTDWQQKAGKKVFSGRFRGANARWQQQHRSQQLWQLQPHCSTALHLTHCIILNAHCTLHSAHCTLHTARCTLQTAHCTLNTAHYTLLNAQGTVHTT